MTSASDSAYARGRADERESLRQLAIEREATYPAGEPCGKCGDPARCPGRQTRHAPFADLLRPELQEAAAPAVIVRKRGDGLDFEFPLLLDESGAPQHVYLGGEMDVDLSTEDVRLQDGTRLTDEVAEIIVADVKAAEAVRQREEISEMLSRNPQYQAALREADAESWTTSEPDVVELSREEGRKMLDERTRRELGMSVEEFEAAYDAGELDLSRSDVIGLVMLLPFAR